MCVWFEVWTGRGTPISCDHCLFSSASAPLYFLPALSGQPPLEPFSKTRKWKRGVLGRGEIKSNGTHAIVQRLLYIFTFWQVPRQAVCLSACLSTNYARGGLFLCFFSFSFFRFLIASAVVEMTQGCCNDRLPATSGCLRGMP